MNQEPKAYNIGLFAGIWPPFKRKEKNMSMSSKVTVTKRFTFCYAHHLPHYVGKCANTHGHNAVLEVEVRGKEEGGYEGMVIDFGTLKKIVGNVLEIIDHTYLNTDLGGFKAHAPTAENIVQWFMAEIVVRLPKGVVLESLRLTETDDSWTTWRRGK